MASRRLVTPTAAATTPAPPASGRPSGSRRSRTCICVGRASPPTWPGRRSTSSCPVSANEPGWTSARCCPTRAGEVRPSRGPRRPRSRAAPGAAASRRPRPPVGPDRPAPVRPTAGAGRRDGAVVDAADSYAGLRSVSIDGQAAADQREARLPAVGAGPGLLAGEPDDRADRRGAGAPTSSWPAAGFNGARLHQKVFEERYLYHADRLGYLVWGEFGDWGSGHRWHTRGQPATDRVVRRPVAGGVERDYSHPSIIGWCPLNETHQLLHDRITPWTTSPGPCSWPPRPPIPRGRCSTPPGTPTGCPRPTSTTRTVRAGPERRSPSEWRGLAEGRPYAQHACPTVARCRCPTRPAILLQRVRRHLVGSRRATVSQRQ